MNLVWSGYVIRVTHSISGIYSPELKQAEDSSIGINHTLTFSVGVEHSIR